MLKTKLPYHDVGQAAYDERFRARRLRSLARMAQPRPGRRWEDVIAAGG